MQIGRFDIYRDKYVSFFGTYYGDGLTLTSIVYIDDDFTSEKNYSLSKEATEKLCSIMTMEEFVEFCKKEGTRGMESFFDEHDISYSSHVF